jgi:hypothetical protein
VIRLDKWIYFTVSVARDQGVIKSLVQTVLTKMQTLAVYFVLYTIMATVTRCDTKLKLVPSHRKESSTTFLRLTALRDDEGLWIARFGEYEVRKEVAQFLSLFNNVF